MHQSFSTDTELLPDTHPANSHPDALAARLDSTHDGIDEIPDIVVRRLPLYVRSLRELQTEGVESVSSRRLAGSIGVTAAQIRRDLSYFGKFGKQGKGYNTTFLIDKFAEILKLDRQWPIALVGLGNLGRAISHYRGLIPSSFYIAAVFDRSPNQIGSTIEGIEIQSDLDIESEVARLGIKLGIIAVPASAAQEVADRLMAGGVQAMLNYAPVLLQTPPNVTVREIDPISAMQSMTYYISDDNPTNG